MTRHKSRALVLTCGAIVLVDLVLMVMFCAPSIIDAATTWLVQSNNAKSTLASTITTGATSMTVAAGTGALFPSTYPYRLVIGGTEIVQVSNRATDVMTISRGAESTTPAQHLAGESVRLNMTAGYLSQVQTAVTGIETGTTTLTEVTTTGDITCGGNFNWTPGGDLEVSACTVDDLLWAKDILDVGERYSAEGKINIYGGANTGTTGQLVIFSGKGGLTDDDNQYSHVMVSDFGLEIWDTIPNLGGNARYATIGPTSIFTNGLFRTIPTLDSLIGLPYDEGTLVGYDATYDLGILASYSNFNTTNVCPMVIIGDPVTIREAATGTDGLLQVSEAEINTAKIETALIGTDDSVIGNVHVYGGSTSGGSVKIYNGANDDTTVDSWQIKSTSAGQLWIGDTASGSASIRLTDTGIVYLGNALAATPQIIAQAGIQQRSLSFEADDTTPSVAKGNIFTIPNTWTAGHNITSFDGGNQYSVIYIVANPGDTDCNIIANAYFVMGGDWNAAAGNTLSLITINGTTWYELSRYP